MPASKLEYEDARSENVRFRFRNTPVEYIGREGKVTGLKVKTDTGEEILETDVVLVAIGSKPARRIVSTTEGIEVDEKGYVITREKPYGMCTLKGVFAGGDVVHQPATVVLAMKEAKKVAEGIAAYVDAKKLLDL
jgi:glutamate synthase (NADPH/NADH) small chain